MYGKDKNKSGILDFEKSKKSRTASCHGGIHSSFFIKRLLVLNGSRVFLKHECFKIISDSIPPCINRLPQQVPQWHPVTVRFDGCVSLGGGNNNRRETQFNPVSTQIKGKRLKHLPFSGSEIWQRGR